SVSSPMKSPLYAPNSMKLGLFSYKSGSLFNCDGGSVLAYQIHAFLKKLNSLVQEKEKLKRKTWHK
ncbi:hypothetical protein M3649_21580, partial [Ureibacillus chungkukjangi]|uniref:hypothetical protein n=1 Tax=Ureibacillus chungkukjangi TaxID=1202712 RepID=UPI001C00618D